MKLLCLSFDLCYCDCTDAAAVEVCALSEQEVKRLLAKWKLMTGLFRPFLSLSLTPRTVTAFYLIDRSNIFL